MTTTTRKPRPPRKSGDPQADRAARDANFDRKAGIETGGAAAAKAEKAEFAEKLASYAAQNGKPPTLGVCYYCEQETGHKPDCEMLKKPTQDTDGTFYGFYFLNHKGEFVVHTRNCKVGLTAAPKQSQYDGKVVFFEIVSQADAIRQLWDDQIREDPDAEGMLTDDTTLFGSGYASDVTFHSCLKALPVSVQEDKPVTEPKPKPDASAVKRDAKQALARLVVCAVADAVASTASKNADILKGMTAEEAAQFAANWLHHLPTGEDKEGRIWPTTRMPKPDRSDWK